MKEKSTLKNIISLTFIGCVLIGLILYILYTDGIHMTRMLLRTADYTWGLLCILLMTGIYVFETFVLYVPLKKNYPEFTYPLSFLSVIICRFFNIITPFSTGGQPFQAYVLHHYNIRVSDTLSALTIKYVIYQLGLFSWAIILLAGNHSFFLTTFQNDLWLILLGTGINLLVTIVVILIALNPKLIKNIAHIFLKLFSHIHIGNHYMIKGLPETLHTTDEAIDNYCQQFRQAQYDKKTILQMVLFTMLQILCNLSIPYTIYRTFGNTGISYSEILTTQIYLHLMIAYIPTPGSSLGAEGGFALLYRSIFQNGLNLSMFLWRICTFYFPFISGFLGYVLVRKRLNRGK